MVEDETYMAEAIIHILKKHHYTVDLVDNGTDGLDYGLSGIYDVIILDIMLPEMDGLSVLKELRQNQVHTPIILLTARSNTEDRVTGLDRDRKSTRLNSSHVAISYAVFCLKKKKKKRSIRR